LRNILSQGDEPRLDVVTAFFNLKGLESLEPEVHALAHLRVVLGKEQEQTFVVGERLLAELEDVLSRGATTACEIERWRDFLTRGSVDIRRYGKAFCHGKTYIVHGVSTLGAVGIVGSSNFTGAGLTTNLELNAVLKQTSAVRDLQTWFEALWIEAEDYKQELIELLGRFTRTYTPYEIYIKVIYEALRDKLDEDLRGQDERPSPIALADFQRDGYLAAKEILENYGGVLIADSVGLGKTFLALRLLEDYAYRERQTALIVCPAAVEHSIWRPYLTRFAIPHEIVSIERASRQDFPVEEYANRFRVIVVDESHNFRNPNTNRWPNLFRIITQGDPDKKVILLTATPVNNTVFDLYHQLRLINRDNRQLLLAAGIPDLWEHFRRAEKNRDAIYEVLEALAVRRSRQFIRQNFPDAEIDGVRIRFPKRELHTVHYSLKATYGSKLYQRIADAIEKLFLAPYQVDTYRRELVEARKKSAKQLPIFEISDERSENITQRLQEALGWSKDQAHDFLMVIGRQTAIAHIMRVLYLKRLESSVEALRISLHRLHRFFKFFLEALKQGRVLKGEDYRRCLQMEASDEEGVEDTADEDTADMESAALPDIADSYDLADSYDVESLCAAVQADLHMLESILTELEHDHADDKVDTLKKLLVSSELRGRKVVVFSYFKDTARYLYRKLTSDEDFLSQLGHRRITIVDSDIKPSERNARIIRFAPRANKPLDDEILQEPIDILISTDVLSEGQNLQDADVIINYDLHWNPVRMVQRVGRLDRIGSPHDVIYVYNFFPEEELDELLGLLERLHQKLDAINRTVGLDASVLGETPNPMDFNILRRLAREDETTFQSLEAESELTVGEFLKQDLHRFLRELGEEKLKRIPLGVGTARKKEEGPAGFFAAFRNPMTNHHHWLFYDEEKKRIVEHRLEAIHHIRSDSSEPAELLPEAFDPRPLIQKLRRHLWNRIRAATLAPSTLPSLQRQIVNWLHALPPSAERNRLLQYFEPRPLAGPALKELRHLWRERSSLSQEKWTNRLVEFAESHPHPPQTVAKATGALAPEQEEELECIAWMRIVLTD